MQSSNNSYYRQLRLMAGVMAIILLSVHFYYQCYSAFQQWQLTYPLIDRLVINLYRSPLMQHSAFIKLLALASLILTLIGPSSSARSLPRKKQIIYTLTGLLLYLGSSALLYLTTPPSILATAYILVTGTGLSSLYYVARSIASQIAVYLSKQIFNQYNESFPQQESPIQAPYSFQFQAEYRFRNQTRSSFISIVNPRRGLLVIGTAGSGKTRCVIRPAIRQSLQQAMPLFLFDLKYDELTRLAYYLLQKNKHRFPVEPTFYSFNFDDLSRSHRCNLLYPTRLEDLTDAAECARAILYGLNRQWVSLQGNFFVESAVNFFTANIWFLKEYQGGRYCTLPHLIELLQTELPKLLSILRSYPKTETLVNSFADAFEHGSMEQLQGQIDSPRIPLAALASPKLYYLLSGNDFTLDINNPSAPKIITIGSNPKKQLVYSPIISLFVAQLLKEVNQKGGLPCEVICDEFASLTANGMDTALATARSNNVGLILGIQDLSQLRKEYGDRHADALFNLPANLISGQGFGESARFVSERFGKILQQKQSVNTGKKDSSTTDSQQLESAVPPSRVASLSSGEFVGFMADTPDHPIEFKAFHGKFKLADADLEAEQNDQDPIPIVAPVSPSDLDANFLRIRQESRQLVDDRLTEMLRTPHLARLIVTKHRTAGRQRPPKP